MKLTIVIAEASVRGLQGTINALGIGITHFRVDQFPGRFRGSLLLIATPEPSDTLKQQFSLTLEVPGQKPQQFAYGEFNADGENQPVVMAQPFEMIIGSEGDYIFRATCDEGSATMVLKGQYSKPPQKLDDLKAEDSE